MALSGGSTPRAIYKRLAENHSQTIDWGKVILFWSDERAVSSDHVDSNYHTAMESGLKNLPILPKNIHKMIGTGDLEANALAYEALLQSLPNQRLDLVMLGMGDDGHTASLFPETHGLHAQNRTVISNFVPKLDRWRLSLTLKLLIMPVK